MTTIAPVSPFTLTPWPPRRAAVTTARPAQVSEIGHLSPAARCPRVDPLALSGAVLLVLALAVGAIDVARVWAGAAPIGASMVLLIAAMPGLTRWAHRLDRRDRRGGGK